MKAGRLLSALAGFLIAAWAHADFAPLKTANTWVYDGLLSTEAAWHPQANPDAKFTLTVRVLSRVRHGDTSEFKVAFRDSLFERKYAGGPAGILPDTVLLDTSLYKGPTADYHVVTGPGNSGIFSLIHPDVFFSTRNPGEKDTVETDASGKLMLKTGWADMPTGAPARAWYVDNAGLYWISATYSSPELCFAPRTEELLLRTFNGRAVTLDETPAGSPLAKAAKVTCAIRKRSRAAAAFRALGSLNVDLRGRVIIQPAALSF